MKLAAMVLALCSLATVGAFIGGSAQAGSLTTDPTKMNKEWVGIVYGPWQNSVVPLLNFRRSQGRSACIWTLQDLDDTYGGHGPSQVRAALQAAWQTWSVRPRWVVLFADHQVGEVSGVSRIGDAGLYNPELGMWEDYIRGVWPLMEVTGDSVPDIAVGRVPAADSVFIHNYVAKAIRHDQDMAARAGYSGSAMLVEDENDAGNDSLWVRHLADSLYAHWDPGESQHSVHYSDYASTGLAQRDAATAAWNEGPGWVVAMGTGSNWYTLVSFWNACDQVNQWAVSQLGATGKYPVLLGLSCGINATDRLYPTTLCDGRGIVRVAKQLLGGAADRGAAAVIAPMRNTIQYWDFLVGKHLLQRLAHGDRTWGEVLVHGLGDAVAESPGAWDHAYQFVLEGDPAELASPGVPPAGVSPLGADVVVGSPYPNVATTNVNIEYRMADKGAATFVVCDVAGRRVGSSRAVWPDGGRHTWMWNLRDGAGRRVQPGVYFVQVSQAGRVCSRRVVVVQ